MPPLRLKVHRHVCIGLSILKHVLRCQPQTRRREGIKYTRDHHSSDSNWLPGYDVTVVHRPRISNFIYWQGSRILLPHNKQKQACEKHHWVGMWYRGFSGSTRSDQAACRKHSANHFLKLPDHRAEWMHRGLKCGPSIFCNSPGNSFPSPQLSTASSTSYESPCTAPAPDAWLL
jgi:hypothetical protein